MCSPIRARRIARYVASRIFRQSISSTSAQATDHASACWRILTASSSRSSGIELLRIADAANATARIEYDGGSDDGSCQRTATGLIDARDESGAVEGQTVRRAGRDGRRHLQSFARLRHATTAILVEFVRLLHQLDDRVGGARAGVASQRLVDLGESLHEARRDRHAPVAPAAPAPGRPARTSALKYSGTICRPASRFGCAKKGALNSFKCLRRKLVSQLRR